MGEKIVSERRKQRGTEREREEREREEREREERQSCIKYEFYFYASADVVDDLAKSVGVELRVDTANKLGHRLPLCVPSGFPFPFSFPFSSTCRVVQSA